MDTSTVHSVGMGEGTCVWGLLVIPAGRGAKVGSLVVGPNGGGVASLFGIMVEGGTRLGAGVGKPAVGRLVGRIVLSRGKGVGSLDGVSEGNIVGLLVGSLVGTGNVGFTVGASVFNFGKGVGAGVGATVGSDMRFSTSPRFCIPSRAEFSTSRSSGSRK